ncbi:MAG: divalent-cation tolerance protein CutA [Candidatus Saccharimonadales bacterium]
MIDVFSELFLTCEDRAEAEKIAQALLERHLIACAKFIPIEARYWWKGEIVDGKEVLLLMESVADNFDKIEAEVAKLHSCEAFVLQALPLTHVSKRAQAWLKDNINGGKID